MAGRPPRLTKELQERIVAMVRIGGYPDVGARACGVPRRTFFEWMARGRDVHPTRKPTAALVAFAEAVDEAVALAEMHHVGRLHEFARGTRRGTRKTVVKSKMTLSQAIQSQWLLSRRFWERWGPRPAVVIDVNDAPESRAEMEDTRPKITIVVAPTDDMAAGEYTVEEYHAKGRPPELPAVPSDDDTGGR